MNDLKGGLQYLKLISYTILYIIYMLYKFIILRLLINKIFIYNIFIYQFMFFKVILDS